MFVISIRHYCNSFDYTKRIKFNILHIQSIQLQLINRIFPFFWHQRVLSHVYRTHSHSSIRLIHIICNMYICFATFSYMSYNYIHCNDLRRSISKNNMKKKLNFLKLYLFSYRRPINSYESIIIHTWNTYIPQQ